MATSKVGTTRAFRHLFDPRLDDQPFRSFIRSFRASSTRAFHDRLNVEEPAFQSHSSSPRFLPTISFPPATFLQTFVFQCFVPISWSVCGVYTELAVSAISLGTVDATPFWGRVEDKYRPGRLIFLLSNSAPRVFSFFKIKKKDRDQF